MIKRIHHINFIVRNLEAAVERYSDLFGVQIGSPESLPHRGVKLARFRLAEIWVVLVQPLDPLGKPAQYLEKHGEGFFLMSCQVDDVREVAQHASAKGIGVVNGEPRQGLDDWQVIDLNPDDLFGATIQLVETRE
jgi:methylmalonyl-CoA/ethylmalonyl-CoA epimerase